MKDEIRGGILGLAVADAMGVPVEFKDREELRNEPVTNMRGYGSHRQPQGTWSDDTSMTLCLMDSLAEKGTVDYTDIMQRFLSWFDKGAYTAHGNVFDSGIATQKALFRFRMGNSPFECGGTGELDNGNGSLMRILPLVFYCRTRAMYSDNLEIVHNVSALTHATKRCQIACGIYTTIAVNLLEDFNLCRVLTTSLEIAQKYYADNSKYVDELKHFERLFKPDFARLPESEIKSTGYVVHTLEAAIWCLLNTDNYRDCVLKAVNLGNDTDTVAAVAGGLAGILYGVDLIPDDWLNLLAKRDYIESLCEKFDKSLQ